MPQPAEPDALEVLRAARGEGWQWPRIQYEPCPQCGFNPSSIPPEELGGRAVELAEGWREFLVGADEATLRAIPEPGVNSPLQYGAHVRDILMVYGERMVLAVEQDSPTVPMFNPPQEVWEAYNAMAVEDLAADIRGPGRAAGRDRGGHGPLGVDPHRRQRPGPVRGLHLHRRRPGPQLGPRGPPPPARRQGDPVLGRILLSTPR